MPRNKWTNLKIMRIFPIETMLKNGSKSIPISFSGKRESMKTSMYALKLRKWEATIKIFEMNTSISLTLNIIGLWRGGELNKEKKWKSFLSKKVLAKKEAAGPERPCSTKRFLKEQKDQMVSNMK